MQSGSEASIEVIAVEVPGGALTVEVIEAASEPVLAVHGISSQEAVELAAGRRPRPQPDRAGPARAG